MIKFLKSIGQEMKEVDWPNGKQLRKDSTTVITISLFFVAFLGLTDWIIQSLLKMFI